MYGKTRFTGAYELLNVFLLVFDEVASILDNKLLAIYLRINKDFLTGLCEFLLPFDTVFDTLSDNELSILHRVLLFKQFLINKCEINDDEKRRFKTFEAILT